MIRITVQTGKRIDMVNITSEVRKAVKESGVIDGICHVFIPHTTAAVTINENADPDVVGDIEAHVSKLIPRDTGFRHAEGNSDGHIKASLFGASETVFVEGGVLVLGTWQGIYLCEFDGPRNRNVLIKVQ